MTQRPSRAARTILESLPPLPFDDAHWADIVKAVSLSPRQAEIVELILRDATTQQIEVVLGIKAPTIKEQRDRIAGRTGTRGRMQLAMHIVAVSRRIDGE